MFKAYTHCRRCRQELRTGGDRSTGICPGCIGVLGADRRGTDARVSQADSEYLSIFANSIGTVFLHARLDEELRTSNVNSVRALVQAIEEKDP